MKVIYQLFILLFFTIACNGQEIKDVSENNVLKTNKLFGEVKTEKEQHYNHIPFLQQIKETKNYEVLQVEDSFGGNLKWDSITENYLVKGNLNYIFSKEGILIDSFNEKNTIIYGNFTFTENFYTTWLIDGNKKEVSFKDILFDYNEKNLALYLTTFKEYYDKSSLVFYGNTFYYYFYFQTQWLRLVRKNIDNLKKKLSRKTVTTTFNIYAVKSQSTRLCKTILCSKKESWSHKRCNWRTQRLYFRNLHNQGRTSRWRFIDISPFW